MHVQSVLSASRAKIKLRPKIFFSVRKLSSNYNIIMSSSMDDITAEPSVRSAPKEYIMVTNETTGEIGGDDKMEIESYMEGIEDPATGQNVKTYLNLLKEITSTNAKSIIALDERRAHLTLKKTKDGRRAYDAGMYLTTFQVSGVPSPMNDIILEAERSVNKLFEVMMSCRGRNRASVHDDDFYYVAGEAMFNMVNCDMLISFSNMIHKLIETVWLHKQPMTKWFRMLGDLNTKKLSVPQYFSWNKMLMVFQLLRHHVIADRKNQHVLTGPFRHDLWYRFVIDVQLLEGYIVRAQSNKKLLNEYTLEIVLEDLQREINKPDQNYTEIIRLCADATTAAFMCDYHNIKVSENAIMMLHNHQILSEFEHFAVVELSMRRYYNLPEGAPYLYIHTTGLGILLDSMQQRCALFCKVYEAYKKAVRFTTEIFNETPATILNTLCRQKDHAWWNPTRTVGNIEDDAKYILTVDPNTEIITMKTEYMRSFKTSDGEEVTVTLRPVHAHTVMEINGDEEHPVEIEKKIEILTIKKKSEKNPVSISCLYKSKEVGDKRSPLYLTDLSASKKIIDTEESDQE